jgi:hypothetical protein
MTTPGPMVWPARLVPAPRGTTGTSHFAAATTVAATSATCLGKTTHSGLIAYMLASRENRWRV